MEENDVLGDLAEMPFEELELLKQKIGLKCFNVALGFSKGKPKRPERTSAPKTFPRENKNRPLEVSSKKRPPRLMPVFQVKKKRVRDPRFDDNCGDFSEEHFSKAYSFLSDIKEREKQKLLRARDKVKDEEEKKKLDAAIKQRTREEQQEKMKKKKKEAKAKLRKQEKLLVGEGKKPFYLKKSDQRTLELAEKFKELKQSGKLDNYMKKKRKKDKAKDMKKTPIVSQC